MKPELFRLLTRACWGVGGFREERPAPWPAVGADGHHDAHARRPRHPGDREFPGLEDRAQAGPRALLYMVVGGGIVAGAAGMLCFYIALKGAPLNRVPPIALTSPLFGAVMATSFLGEPLTYKTVAGMLLTVGGIVPLTV